MKTVRLYDDHRAAGYSDGAYPKIHLCDECAEARGGDVTLLDTPNQEQALYCEDCGPNEAAEKAEQEEAELHFRDEPGTSRR